MPYYPWLSQLGRMRGRGAAGMGLMMAQQAGGQLATQESRRRHLEAGTSAIQQNQLGSLISSAFDPTKSMEERGVYLNLLKKRFPKFEANFRVDLAKDGKQMLKAWDEIVARKGRRQEKVNFLMQITDLGTDNPVFKYLSAAIMKELLPEQSEAERAAAGLPPAEQAQAQRIRAGLPAPPTPPSMLEQEKLRAEVEKTKGELPRTRIVPAEGKADAWKTELLEPAGAKEPASLEQIAGMRKEYTSLSGDFIKVRDAMGRIEASAKDPSAAGDLALIFNYMKVLDPGSVVRESEFATAANAAGVPARIRNTYNKVLTGERLAVEQRQDFLDRARKLFASQQGFQKNLVKQYTKQAERAGIDPSRVIVQFDVPFEVGEKESGLAEDYTDEEIRRELYGE